MKKSCGSLDWTKKVNVKNKYCSSVKTGEAVPWNSPNSDIGALPSRLL